MDDRVDKKMDKILDKISNIDVTLAKQQISLDEHIRRTAIAEQHIEAIREDIKPMQKHINMVQGGLKVLAALGAVIFSILKLLRKI